METLLQITEKLNLQEQQIEMCLQRIHDLENYIIKTYPNKALFTDRKK
jgi:hypothetical protein